ncbi:MAG: AMP-binding protein, partial [Rubripirellula sp.]
MGQLPASADAQSALKKRFATSADTTYGQPGRSMVMRRRNDTAHVASNTSVAGIATYKNVPAFGLLQHAAEKIPNRDAVIYGDHQWSYQDLNRKAIHAAAMLQRLGIRPGDRVGILLPNVPEYIIAANAIWRAGGVAIA